MRGRCYRLGNLKQTRFLTVLDTTFVCYFGYFYYDNIDATIILTGDRLSHNKSDR
ncbi:hypothetical protein [Dapis sp. BLCC M172]|uniref:hypothetical protein n=1 Tax=Dapis sp. BLCC M172 TaxID=2975281 RepID=UPI003CF2E8FC